MAYLDKFKKTKILTGSKQILERFKSMGLKTSITIKHRDTLMVRFTGATPAIESFLSKLGLTKGMDFSHVRFSSYLDQVNANLAKYGKPAILIKQAGELDRLTVLSVDEIVLLMDFIDLINSLNCENYDNSDLHSDVIRVGYYLNVAFVA